LGDLYLTRSQDGGQPTWPDLFSIKFGTKTHTKQQTVLLTDNIHNKACTLTPN